MPEKRSSARKPAAKWLYLMPVLTKSLDILELLQSQGRPMSLEAVYRASKISKTTVYRILKILEHRGYISYTQDGLYSYVSCEKRMCFGFGSQNDDLPFSRSVTESLKNAAAVAGVNLIVLDNHYDAHTAVLNAEEFVRQGVDLVIEFQMAKCVAPIIADKIAAANIPLIAVEMPHPHAIFYGVDNYRVGHAAGDLLAQHANQNWQGRVDWVLGLDIEEAGTVVQSRITGAFEAIREQVKPLQAEAFVRMDGRGLREESRKLVYEFLQRHPHDSRILIAAANDTSALGTLAAVRQLRREQYVAIVGQDCIEEMEAELGNPNSPVIGTISSEADKYGPSLIHLGLSILRGQIVPPYNYSEYRVITRAVAAAAD